MMRTGEGCLQELAWLILYNDITRAALLREEKRRYRLGVLLLRVKDSFWLGAIDNFLVCLLSHLLSGLAFGDNRFSGVELG